MKRFRTLAAAGVAVAVASTLAIAAGNWSTLPIVGSASFCGSTVTGTGSLGGITGQGQGSTGSICGQTIPAGPPAITGNELVPADTNLTGGAPPQTVTIPTSLLFAHGQGAMRNALIGGDFATNLWQRGTTPISATTAATATMTADRWFAISSGNTLTISKQTGATDIITSAGLLASMRVNRPSGTDVTPICVGQYLDKQAAARFVGNNAVFSVYGLNGSTMSAANGAVTMTIAYVTAADSATPGTNTGTFALGTTTGYTAAVTATSQGTTGTVASGVATVPFSTTWTRYGVAAAIPSTATGIGVKVCYTPVGTGASTDWFEIAGAQLEAQNAGVTAPGAFARRPAAEEALLQQYYTWGPGQEIIGVNTGTFALCVSTGVVNIGFKPPVPMFIEPTTATSTLTAGTWSIQTAAAVTGLGTITITAAATDNRLITMNSTAACTTTLPYTLVGGAGATGLLLFSAEP